MPRKRALIVDDSKSARLILTRRLKKHKLAVDNVPSAEKALEYLASERPDVIFMDHMMPGMDGLQALQAIKENPLTATIPVLMYTSQSGDLYLGQARALGAVGVLPKTTRQIELANVLASLNLINGSRPQIRAVDAEDERAPAAPEGGWPERRKPAAPKPDAAELSEDERRLREYFDRRLRGTQAEIQRELSISLDRWAERFSEQLGSRLELTGARLAAMEAGAAARSRRWPLAMVVAAAVFGLLLGFAIGVLSGGAETGSLSSTGAAARLPERDMAVADGATVAPARIEKRADAARERDWQALEFSANQERLFDFQTAPFDDARADLLSELVLQLRETGFSGTLRMEAHIGDFCMQMTAEGWVLAPDSMPAGDCDRLGWSRVDAEARSAGQSVQFANRLAALGDGDEIAVEIASLGNLVPLVSYPSSPTGISAGEWNDIARRNNRVETYLVRDR